MRTGAASRIPGLGSPSRSPDIPPGKLPPPCPPPHSPGHPAAVDTGQGNGRRGQTCEQEASLQSPRSTGPAGPCSPSPSEGRSRAGHSSVTGRRGAAGRGWSEQEDHRAHGPHTLQVLRDRHLPLGADRALEECPTLPNSCPGAPGAQTTHPSLVPQALMLPGKPIPRKKPQNGL